ncbi:hypothetical protein ACFFKE_11415 [Streptomyces mutabilis]|uniref:hypothetical protein n=1 Tax=Streptomyces mutabilis TaxID=67332 RepID=UPI0035EBBC37
MKSYEVPAGVRASGLAPGEEDEAFRSKFRYVLTRLRPLAVPELTTVARKVVDEYDVPALEQILASLV